jgi:hypothetical protein
LGAKHPDAGKLRRKLRKEGKVDIFIVGADKSGTTWLADMLRRHPEVYVPPRKELHYFNKKMLQGAPNFQYNEPLSWYLRFFRDASDAQLLCDATPEYLVNENCARDMQAHNSKARIVVVLREPVSKTLSLYNSVQQQGIIRRSLTLRDFIQEQVEMVERAKYFYHLRPYFEVFPRTQIGVFLYDDLARDSKAFLRAVEGFLGVAILVPEEADTRANVTGKAKHPKLARALQRLRLYMREHNLIPVVKAVRACRLDRLFDFIVKQRSECPVAPGNSHTMERRMLQQGFKEDIEALELLIGRDLSAWKGP